MLRRNRQGGFTLVELTVSIAILGIVMAALTGAMLLALKSTAEANDALGEAGDVQLAAAYFPDDVAGSNTMTASGTPKCGTGTLVIELAGPDFNPADLSDTTRVISYVRSTTPGPNGSQVTEVHRLACVVNNPSPTYPLTPDSDDRVADQLSEGTMPTATCQNAAGAAVACSSTAAVKATLVLTADGGQVTNIIGQRSTS